MGLLMVGTTNVRQTGREGEAVAEKEATEIEKKCTD